MAALDTTGKKFCGREYRDVHARIRRQATIPKSAIVTSPQQVEVSNQHVHLALLLIRRSAVCISRVFIFAASTVSSPSDEHVKLLAVVDF